MLHALRFWRTQRQTSAESCPVFKVLKYHRIGKQKMLFQKNFTSPWLFSLESGSFLSGFRSTRLHRVQAHSGFCELFLAWFWGFLFTSSAFKSRVKSFSSHCSFCLLGHSHKFSLNRTTILQAQTQVYAYGNGVAGWRQKCERSLLLYGATTFSSLTPNGYSKRGNLIERKHCLPHPRGINKVWAGVKCRYWIIDNLSTPCPGTLEHWFHPHALRSM